MARQSFGRRTQICNEGYAMTNFILTLLFIGAVPFILIILLAERVWRLRI